jgi:DNA invertase Pin-like site-specific DNA recombinase
LGIRRKEFEMSQREIRVVAIYGRVSLSADKGQDINMQLNELREYAKTRGWEVKEYADNGISGSKDNRPALNQLMKDAKAGKFDCVLCWKLDRFGRSLKHLLLALDEFIALGIAFIALRDSIDLSTPTGKLMFSIIGAFAEFERCIIIERVKAGLQNAKRKGKRLGRKPIPPIDHKKIIDVYLSDKSQSIRNIAKKINMNYGTVNKTLSFFRDGKIDIEGFQVQQHHC